MPEPNLEKRPNPRRITSPILHIQDYLDLVDRLLDEKGFEPRLSPRMAAGNR